MPESHPNLMDDRKVLAKAKLLFFEPNPIMYSAKIYYFEHPKECAGNYTCQAAYTEDELLNKLSVFMPDIVLVDISQFIMHEEFLTEVKNSIHPPKDIIAFGTASDRDEIISLELNFNKIKFIEGKFDPISTIITTEFMNKLGLLVREIAIKHGLYERTTADSWVPYNPKEKIKLPTIPSVEQLPQKIAQIIAEQLAVKPEEVTPAASFIDDLGADSLDAVELVMALEEEFGIEIPDEDAEKMTTVGEAIKYIQEKIAKEYKI